MPGRATQDRLRASEARGVDVRATPTAIRNRDAPVAIDPHCHVAWDDPGPRRRDVDGMAKAWKRSRRWRGRGVRTSCRSPSAERRLGDRHRPQPVSATAVPRARGVAHLRSIQDAARSFRVVRLPRPVLEARVRGAGGDLVARRSSASYRRATAASRAIPSSSRREASVPMLRRAGHARRSGSRAPRRHVLERPSARCRSVPPPATRVGRRCRRRRTTWRSSGPRRCARAPPRRARRGDALRRRRASATPAGAPPRPR